MIETDNWDEPLLQRAFVDNEDRNTIVLADPDDPRQKIQDRMKRCEEALAIEGRKATLEEEEDVLWVGRKLVQSGKFYADEKDYPRWMALAEELRKKQRLTVSPVEVVDKFLLWILIGYYLVIWDMMRENLSPVQ